MLQYQYQIFEYFFTYTIFILGAPLITINIFTKDGELYGNERF